MKAPILSPTFKWIPSSDHADPNAFRERQRERIRRMQGQQKTVAQFQRKEASK